MEYRRKRKRRRSSTSTGSGTAKAITVLAAVAVLVYLISASAAGTWIAERVLAPAFTWFDELVTRAAKPKEPLEKGKTPQPTGSSLQASSVTGEIKLPSIECFALQMGVYSDKNNASSQAQLLQQRGAGGYVMEDSGRYRVLAAAYADEASLKQVRTQLTAEGLESASYTFSAPESILRVTASKAQLDGISEGFAALKGLQEEMGTASLAFDQKQAGIAEGKAAVNALLAKLREANDAFVAVADSENYVLDAAKTCFAEYDRVLSSLSEYETDRFVDFSSKMKYTHLSMTHAYVGLVAQVSGMA